MAEDEPLVPLEEALKAFLAGDKTKLKRAHLSRFYAKELLRKRGKVDVRKLKMLEALLNDVDPKAAHKFGRPIAPLPELGDDL
jgi:hypothetical protein